MPSEARRKYMREFNAKIMGRLAKPEGQEALNNLEVFIYDEQDE